MKLFVLAFAVVALNACGDRQTVASKSAAAYREAQAKGAAPAGGHQHDAVDHSTMDHSTSPMTAEDHAAMGHAPRTDPHAGHAMPAAAAASADPHAQHRAPAATARDPHEGHAMPAAPDPHAQHRALAQPAATPDPHAGHGAMPSAPPAGAAPRAPTTSSEIAKTRPAATLVPDAFDAPVPISVSEASKPAPEGAEEHQHPPPGKEQP